jgi:hypothetical protein
MEPKAMPPDLRAALLSAFRRNRSRRTAPVRFHQTPVEEGNRDFTQVPQPTPDECNGDFTPAIVPSIEYNSACDEVSIHFAVGLLIFVLRKR